MTIKYAILGLLSWKPFTGYDLKKIFAESASFYWSGNNNQIYRTLIQLFDDGIVTKEVLHQENYPSKKIYTITEKGKSELDNWVSSMPEQPQLKNSFLIQLAWADRLAPDDLDSFLKKYEDEVHMQLLMQQEKARRGKVAPRRTPRETYLWDKILENRTGFYENELNWISRLRKELKVKYSSI